MLRHNLGRVVLLLSVTICGACSVGERHAVAEQEVVKIRHLIFESRFEEVYDNASEEFKRTVLLAEFEKTLSTVRHELGEPERFRLVQKGVSQDLSHGMLLILIYDANTPDRVVRDEFVFEMKNGRPKLFNYRYEPK